MIIKCSDAECDSECFDLRATICLESDGSVSEEQITETAWVVARKQNGVLEDGSSFIACSTCGSPVIITEEE